MTDTKVPAINIVNQLFDIAEVPVAKRQAINDEATEFVETVLFAFLVTGIDDFSMEHNYFSRELLDLIRLIRERLPRNP